MELFVLVETQRIPEWVCKKFRLKGSKLTTSENDTLESPYLCGTTPTCSDYLCYTRHPRTIRLPRLKVVVLVPFLEKVDEHAHIPLNYKAANSLKKWLEVREPMLDPALFLTALKKPMGKRSVQLIVEKYLAEAGIENASVQTLRHTMAVHHIARGTNLKTLADILGDQPQTLERLIPAAKRVHQKALQEHAL